jgi:branched-chain amino acid transport system substrate-binding protein
VSLPRPIAKPRSPSPRAIRVAIAVSGALLVVAAALGGRAQLNPPAGSPAAPIRIGAVFPLTGSAGPLARQQLAGVEIARDLINARGGVDGRPIELEVRDLERGSDAPAVMASLKSHGVQAVIGAYASDLSIAASAAANAGGLVYWEGGAVADRLTGRGLPLVFRVGASGTTLGTNSASFAASQLAPRLHKAHAELRLAIVSADDAYARSVADAARRTAAGHGVSIVANEMYSLTLPRWPELMARLAAARPDVIVLASHIPDGIAFRRAMLAAGLKVGALIGSTMAECSPDFAGDLGADAVGIFASDRPTGGFRPGVLRPEARATYDRFAAAWATANTSAANPSAAPTPGIAIEPGYGNGGDAEYSITGPVLTSGPREPTEEGLAGFSAAWALFADVMPSAAAGGRLPTAAGVAQVARDLDLPPGSLPNGAGIHFSADPATLGQNERSVGVIWQWQAVRSYAFVWPASYATGPIRLVPLPR